jgi:hypothetical protein
LSRSRERRERDPGENICQLMRDNWLPKRAFASCDITARPGAGSTNSNGALRLLAAVPGYVGHNQCRLA